MAGNVPSTQEEPRLGLGPPAEPTTAEPMLGPEDLAALRRRLRRVQGQVGAVVTMLEGGRQCREVVHVISAATAALNKSGFVLLNHAMKQCLSNPNSTAADLAELERLFLDLT